MATDLAPGDQPALPSHPWSTPVETDTGYQGGIASRELPPYHRELILSRLSQRWEPLGGWTHRPALGAPVVATIQNIDTTMLDMDRPTSAVDPVATRSVLLLVGGNVTHPDQVAHDTPPATEAAISRASAVRLPTPTFR